MAACTARNRDMIRRIGVTKSEEGEETGNENTPHVLLARCRRGTLTDYSWGWKEFRNKLPDRLVLAGGRFCCKLRLLGQNESRASEPSLRSDAKDPVNECDLPKQIVLCQSPDLSFADPNYWLQPPG
jgi:hypothetical protein